MKEKSIYLVLAVFNGIDNAETALTQLKKRDRDIKSAVVMQKDAEEQVQFKDVGLTPGKGAVSGIVLGGVVGGRCTHRRYGSGSGSPGRSGGKWEVIPPK